MFEGYPASVLERFKAWHRDNPHVYREFVLLARQMKATGRARYSSRTIMEVMRWHYDLKTVGGVFEVNNDFTPIYVRLLIYNHPEFDGFFELREVRSLGRGSKEERRREDEGGEE